MRYSCSSGLHGKQTHTSPKLVGAPSTLQSAGLTGITLGIVVVLIGQALRSMAMIQASTNFSHMVAHHKVNGHRLVKEGVYAYVSRYSLVEHVLMLDHRWFRHPSYTGFFYWAVGTQMVLQNHACFIIFASLLLRFFYQRIRCKYLPRLA
jgi:protein-S-isoprenylcysteine O-methyltransferase